MFTKNCRESNNATEADVEAMMEGKILETQSAKCTVTCALKEFRIVIARLLEMESNALNWWKFIGIIFSNSNQIKEKNGKFELNVDVIVKLAQAGGLDAEKTAILQEVGEKCKTFEIEDQ